MPSELESGALVDDRYEVLAVCGRGGMSTVYRALDRSLGREIALKVFHSASPDDDARRRGEAVLLAGLTHPGLVVLFDAALDHEPPYVTMELVDGESLADRLRRGPLDLETAAAILTATADALGAVHASGIVHRDIKPANILLPRIDDAHRVARLADFGIARLIEAPGLTATGTVIGTAAYLSPEQVTGGAVTAASDVYSLGLVLIETLTGCRAFSGTAVETMAARLTRAPDLEDAALVTVRTLLADMTRLDPAERPTAAEVADRLRGDSATRVLLSPDAPTEPATTLPAAALVDGVSATGAANDATADATASTVVLAGTLAAAAPGAASPSPPRPREESRSRSRPRILAVVGAVAAMAVLGGILWAALATRTDAPASDVTSVPGTSSVPADTAVDTTPVPTTTAAPTTAAPTTSAEPTPEPTPDETDAQTGPGNGVGPGGNGPGGPKDDSPGQGPKKR